MKWSEKLALGITKAVGTMTCALVFTALSFVSLPAAIASHNIITIVAWITQTFLQLVLLSIILAAQNIQDKKHNTTHEYHESHSRKLDEIISKLPQCKPDQSIPSRPTKRTLKSTRKSKLSR